MARASGEGQGADRRLMNDGGAAPPMPHGRLRPSRMRNESPQDGSIEGYPHNMKSANSRAEQAPGNAPCPHAAIGASLDRWRECHWHLHQMELHYHDPDPFRYSLNSFIRSAKEVPGILMADLQSDTHVRTSIDAHLQKLNANALFATLKQRRDFLVHRGMLAPKSRGSVGTTEGGRIKITFPFPVAAHESSDEAYERYKAACRADRVWRQLSGPDCDSTPTIWRTWLIEEFPDKDLLEVAFEAWLLIGEVLSAVVIAFGGSALDLTMSCRHDPNAIKIKRFSQREFFLSVDGIDLEDEIWARAAAHKPNN